MRRLNITTAAVGHRPLSRREVLCWGGWLGAALLASPLDKALAASVPVPKRIVSIGGALTEMVYVLGASPQLAGVDTTSLFPEAATRLPSVGYARALSTEGILSLAPDLVIATEDAGPPEVIRKLQSANVRLQILNANHRFEGMLQRLQQVGDLVGKPTLAQRHLIRLKAEWLAVNRQIQRQAIQKGKASVLFILSHGPGQIMVGGKETSADAMLQYAGVRNAMGSVSGYKPMTTEAVIAAQPDILLFTSQGLSAIGGIEGALKLPGIDQTPAGKHRRIVAQEAMQMLGFGPRLPQALGQLHTALHHIIRA